MALVFRQCHCNSTKRRLSRSSGQWKSWPRHTRSATPSSSSEPLRRPHPPYLRRLLPLKLLLHARPVRFISAERVSPGPTPKVHVGDRMSGAAYGTGRFSKLWREYANADRRWRGTDPTVVSLENLTVLVASPLALWCAEMVKRGEWNHLGRKGVDNGKWFWVVVLATGELYSGQ